MGSMNSGYAPMGSGIMHPPMMGTVLPPAMMTGMRPMSMTGMPPMGSQMGSQMMMRPPPTLPASGAIHAGHGLVGFLEIDSVKDMPAPVRANLNNIVATVYIDADSLQGGVPR